MARASVAVAVCLCATSAQGKSGNKSPQDVYSRAELSRGIAGFYDASSGLWERVWGEHMHHGYYPPGSRRKDHKQAQVDMIEAVLTWSGTKRVRNVLDAGCGIGGSTRHIVHKFDCQGIGITLSPKQAARATELSEAQGLGDKARFMVADAQRTPFSDGQFDLIWSLESGEHMPDKQQFVSELCRVCAPGGRVIIVTWCHRDLEPGEEDLKPREQRLLRAINKVYYLPRWCSVSRYVDLLEAAGMEQVQRADWTDSISRFWPAVIGTALRPSGIVGLVRAGLTTTKGAMVMPLMIRGYRRGVIKFGLVTAVKPSGPRKGGRRARGA